MITVPNWFLLPHIWEGSLDELKASLLTTDSHKKTRRTWFIYPLSNNYYTFSVEKPSIRKLKFLNVESDVEPITFSTHMLQSVK